MAHQADREAWSAKATEKRVRDWLRNSGLPTNRREGERRQLPKDSDPLADMWVHMHKASDQSNGGGQWNVRYEGSGEWIFKVRVASSDPKETLGSFFIRLGHTLNGPVPAELAKKV